MIFAAGMSLACLSLLVRARNWRRRALLAERALADVVELCRQEQRRRAMGSAPPSVPRRQPREVQEV